ncbi:NifR3 family TIM-barrel protein [Hydrogenophaga taeniospiralis CCUG 15921]|uniref:NifR3 family TIM-barrel protein n=1 Tax=Hydrogenophaga taeniospiralis CCUG 15921 TaxID=1281780 RepID=A0A9X4SA53_9BURK|nr:NifR3 family TIM-barrel protein [Hydrogenophaga taeniospiralis CCUG 15921]
MVTSRPDLQDSLKTSRRADHSGEPGPIAVQIAGTDAAMMADAARYNIDRGAQIIDINMGCPAKKVCNKWAGSALMQDESLALEIIEAVVAAAVPHGVPVTLKMRTGWSASGRNAPTIARAAEAAGVQMLTVHGRTREQGYKGEAEHETVAHIKSRVRIPVVANGDITSPQKAHDVLRRTGADAIMIGRAAQGRPWIFREIAHYLATGEALPPPDLMEVKAWLLDHLEDHYSLYGEFTGVRSARKHLAGTPRRCHCPAARPRCSAGTSTPWRARRRNWPVCATASMPGPPQEPTRQPPKKKTGNWPHEQPQPARLCSCQPGRLFPRSRWHRPRRPARHAGQGGRKALARSRDAAVAEQPVARRAMAGSEPQHPAQEAA